MKTNNYTEFPSMRYSNTLSDGRVFGVLMVKAAYDINDDGNCILSEEQEPFNFSDQTYGELNISSVNYPSDLVPFKPATDVIINAIAYSPTEEKSQSWLVKVKLNDDYGLRIEKELRVYGTRSWTPKWDRQLQNHEKKDEKRFRSLFIDWELSQAELISEIPIKYEYSYGGEVVINNDKDVRQAFEHNPLGIGLIDPEWSNFTLSYLAPQIEDPENPISEPYKQYKPAGFGAIPPHWLPRRPLGGTYDQNWIENIWPKWPSDYKFSYHNSAPNDQTCFPYLSGNLSITFSNMRKNKSTFHVRIQLPKLVANVIDNNNNYNSYKMNCDTLLIDIDKEELFDCRVFVTFRLIFNKKTTKIIKIYNYTQELEPVVGKWGNIVSSGTPYDFACEYEEKENTNG